MICSDRHELNYLPVSEIGHRKVKKKKKRWEATERVLNQKGTDRPSKKTGRKMSGAEREHSKRLETTEAQWLKQVKRIH